jgi:hypothetical protein
LEDDVPALDFELLRLRPEWHLACRVAASKRLCKSELLPRFLLYVCEQHLMGHPQEITEQRIGTQIFNRVPGYDPGEDNIVRSYARTLRKRLDEYFEDEGSDEPTRIVIPRGGYIPLFVPAGITNQPPGKTLQAAAIPLREEAPEPPPVPVSEPETPFPPAATPRAWWTGIAAALLGIIVGLLIASAGWIAARRIEQSRERSAAHPIWAQLFQPNRVTLIVPADSGLGILQNLTGHLVPLDQYANGSYLNDMQPLPGVGLDNLNDLRRQRYTSVVDLNITSMLTRLPEFAAGHSEIRYARSITAEDLRTSNAILLGSSHTNPWVSLFESRLNFKLQYTPEVDQSFVLNQHPTPTEKAFYRNGFPTANRTYGVVDYVPSLDGAGHVLIIQGLNMAATQAAADVLFNGESMQHFLRDASVNGSVRSFELLVETSSIGATAPDVEIIATRFYPPLGPPFSGTN